MDNRIHPKPRPDTDNQIHPKPRPGKLHLMLIIFFALGLVAGAELLAPRLAGTLHGPPSVSTATPPEDIQATPAPARRLSAEEEMIEVGPVYTTTAEGQALKAREGAESTINESLTTQELINSYRVRYGRKPIKWDKGLYLLAVNRSKDMYLRNYFDHVTPEGECAGTLAPKLGIYYKSIAENVYYTECKYCSSFHFSPSDAVNSWMESRGHRYNLLYSGHIAGAVGCYQEGYGQGLYQYCVFLGANNDPYGLGSGKCSTGEEGLRFWETAPIQPGEVYR